VRGGAGVSVRIKRRHRSRREGRVLGFEAQEMLPDYTLDRRPELLLEVATACEGLLRVNLATLPLTSRIKLRHYAVRAASIRRSVTR